MSEHEHEREREHERTGMAERESARARRVRAAARTMLEEEIAAREQLPAGPPQHVGPAGGARRHHKAAQHLHDLQLCGGKRCCAARAPRCIAANASTRRAAAPKAAIGSPCPTSSVAMLMHDAMRQGEVVQHGKDCAAWWRTMPHACAMMSARRPQAQAECRKAARAAAAWPRRGRLRSWQARLSQLTWSRRATRRALYERNCESLQELTFSQSPCCRGRFVRNPSTRTIVVSLIAVVPA